jgi:hypothetical protein
MMDLGLVVEGWELAMDSDLGRLVVKVLDSDHPDWDHVVSVMVAV